VCIFNQEVLLEGNARKKCSSCADKAAPPNENLQIAGWALAALGWGVRAKTGER
jgi:hypothetical protein